jgi:WD40 repeat protein
MSSLDKQYAAILGFFSYSREDDRGDRGALSTLRQVIQSELSAQLGRAQKSCRIWQDQAAIPVGTEWENQIKLGISQSVFFIPIITPRVVRSERCAFEFEAFLARERELGRDDLVFPFLYIDVPELDDERIWHADPVLSVVGARQYFDGRDLRFKPVAEARASIGQFCRNIANAIRREWETPEAQRRLEAEGQAKAEEEGRRRAAEQQAEEKRQRRKAQAEEKRRKEAEAETARLAEEERQRREAEAARVAEEKRRKEAEAETARLAEEERKRREAQAARVAEEENRRKEAEAARLAEEEKRRREAAAEAARLADEERQRHEAEAARAADGERREKVATAAAAALIDAASARAQHAAPRSRRSLAVIAGAIAALLLIGIVYWNVSNPRPVVAIKDVATAPAVPPSGALPAKTTAPPLPTPPSQPENSEANAPAKTDTSSPGATASCSQTGVQLASAGGSFDPVTLKPDLAAAKELRTVAVSPDGARIATAGDDAVIRVWDASSLKLIRQIGGAGGHTDAVYSVTFSEDGDLLASAGWDGTVRIWDAHTYAPRQTFIAAGDAGRVRQWSVAFEPGHDPHYVVSTGDDGYVWIWDLTTGALHNRRASSDPPLHQAARSLSFAPAGAGEFATAGFDGRVRFFPDSGKIFTVPASSGKLLHVAYSPNSKLLASAGVDAAGQNVKIWNAASHSLFKSYEGHRRYAVSVAWSADGSHIVSGGGYEDRTVRLWDVQSGSQQVFPPKPSADGHTADVEAVAFHPNGKWLISASEDKTMKIWDIASGAVLLSVIGFDNGQYLAYAPSGCFTGSSDARRYVKFLTKNGQDVTATAGGLFVPADSAAAPLLPR